MRESTGEEKRATRRRPGAERLLEAASELFYREGIGAVGVDTISERAGVSKRTLYNRFGGKDELVAEYLRRRDERWRAYLRGVTEGVEDPGEKLLAVFGAYGEWLAGGDFRGCRFAHAAAEIPDPDHPARVVARRHKEGVGEHLATLAKEAGFRGNGTLAARVVLVRERAHVGGGEPRSPEALRAAKVPAGGMREPRTWRDPPSRRLAA